MPDGDINLREGLTSLGKDAYIASLHDHARRLSGRERLLGRKPFRRRAGDPA